MTPCSCYDLSRHDEPLGDRLVLRVWQRQHSLIFEGANFKTVPVTVGFDGHLLNPLQFEAVVRIAVNRPGHLLRVEFHLVHADGFHKNPCTVVWKGDVQT